MNERIRELIDECTEWITGTIDGDVECFDKEKFAQLIVKECKLAINQIDADDASMAIGLYRAEVAIDNHFGVNE